MNKKIVYGLALFFAIIIFTVSYTFAANNNSMLGDAANVVRNAVGQTENTVENAARDVSNASKDATKDAENAGNSMTNSMTSGIHNDENNASTFMGTTGDDSGYTATRTSTTGDATLLGMNSTAWIWLILALAAIGIIAIVYYYSTQTTDSNYDSED